MIFHILRHGFALCQFCERLPANWPDGHRWVGKDDSSDANCASCIAINNGEIVPDDDHTTGSVEVEDALMLPLIFHSGGVLTSEQCAEWKRITGSDQMTTRVMCDHLRLVHALVKYPLDRDLEKPDLRNITDNSYRRA